MRRCALHALLVVCVLWSSALAAQKKRDKFKQDAERNEQNDYDKAMAEISKAKAILRNSNNADVHCARAAAHLWAVSQDLTGVRY